MEGDFKRARRKGVAAVLAVGIMCSKDHRQLVEDEHNSAWDAESEHHPAIEGLGNHAADSLERILAKTSGGAGSRALSPLSQPHGGDGDSVG